MCHYKPWLRIHFTVRAKQIQSHDFVSTLQ
jgi:hypothetical protein